MTAAKLTPMMQQYVAAKEKYPDALLMFRLGDFYELFFDDARIASRVLGLTLTSRDKDKGEDAVPMAGVPHHAAKGYISRLTDDGYKVAVCEQIEEPGKKGMFRREVSRVVSPGMVLDDESLTSKAENVLAALVAREQGFGLAAIDVSTGRFRVTAHADLSLITDELLRVHPRELHYDSDERFAPMHARLKRTRLVPSAKASAEADPAHAASTLCLAALSEALMHESKHIGEPERYALGEHLLIDETSRKNLELTQTLIGAKREGSLLHHIDRTRTGMGARLLSQWLTAPLVSREKILERQAVVAHFVERPGLREGLLRVLERLYDLERLNGRLGALQATPRDLGSLRDTLALLPELRALIEGTMQAPDALIGNIPARLSALCRALGDFSRVVEELSRALVDAPPVPHKEGGIFRPGFDAEIDELASLAESGKDFLLQMEARERERTKIASLKIRYNRVFGYAIEITKAHMDRVPKDYVRKQTLANAERFVTDELRQYEEKVLHADERRLSLEEQRFLELRGRLLGQCTALKQAAFALAEIDALLSLSVLSADEDFCRPELSDERETELEAARHPVVEAFVRAAGERYVPFDVCLQDGSRLLMITGPNMAGKSTVLRAVAVVSVLAQMGCFVPCKRARIGIADKVFTRVGASDNLSQGQSTFMVEMSETAAILRGASARSLVIVDEIGRGTSTFDGLSLAWSVAEHLHDATACRTLFATHYHELIELEQQCEHVKNYHMAVKEYAGEVVFLRELREGGMSQSYGIEVGRLAGLPKSVIARAKELLSELEQKRHAADGSPRAPLQLELFVPAHPKLSALQAKLRHLELERMTPIDALNTLAELQKIAR